MKRIPVYEPGDNVYVIAFSNDSVDNVNQAEKVDPWSRDFAKIFKVVIAEIYINSDGIKYAVKDAGSNKEWNEPFAEEHISSNTLDLYTILIKRWRL